MLAGGRCLGSWVLVGDRTHGAKCTLRAAGPWETLRPLVVETSQTRGRMDPREKKNGLTIPQQPVTCTRVAGDRSRPGRPRAMNACVRAVTWARTVLATASSLSSVRRSGSASPVAWRRRQAAQVPSLARPGSPERSTDAGTPCFLPVLDRRPLRRVGCSRHRGTGACRLPGRRTLGPANPLPTRSETARPRAVKTPEVVASTEAGMRRVTGMSSPSARPVTGTARPASAHRPARTRRGGRGVPPTAAARRGRGPRAPATARGSGVNATPSFPANPPLHALRPARHTCAGHRAGQRRRHAPRRRHRLRAEGPVASNATAGAWRVVRAAGAVRSGLRCRRRSERASPCRRAGPRRRLGSPGSPGPPARRPA